LLDQSNNIILLHAKGPSLNNPFLQYADTLFGSTLLYIREHAQGGGGATTVPTQGGLRLLGYVAELAVCSPH
jgi:hypothetical protein